MTMTQDDPTYPPVVLNLISELMDVIGDKPQSMVIMALGEVLTHVINDTNDDNVRARMTLANEFCECLKGAIIVEPAGSA